jgi:RimJ/RimL family protein N-acetyltransferase
MQRVDDVDVPEIGYLIHRPFWRRGFALEAAMAVRDYAFDTLGIERVISLIRPENVPSRGVARKLGMKPGRHIVRKGLDHIVFSMTPVDRPRPADE